jgi:hypothetical protein
MNSPSLIALSQEQLVSQGNALSIFNFVLALDYFQSLPKKLKYRQ